MAERGEWMLTTVDNPFDPFTQWSAWLAWDTNAGYYTPALLARVSITSDELSEADQHDAIQNAIDEIVSLNASGMHRKVSLDWGKRNAAREHLLELLDELGLVRCFGHISPPLREKQKRDFLSYSIR